MTKISPLHYLVGKKAAYHLAAKDDVYQSWVAKYPNIEQAQTGQEMLQLATADKKGKISYTMIEEFSGNVIFEFIIIIGVVHISLAFLRYMRRNFSGIGVDCFLGWRLSLFPDYAP